MGQLRFAVALALAAAGSAATAQAADVRIEIGSVLVKLVEQVEVSAEEAGVLAEVAVREGAMVSEGDLLARIVDDDARVGFQRAEIELDIARRRASIDVNVRYAAKSAAVAKAELQRSIDSRKRFSRSISDTEMDRLQLVVDRAELEVEQAKHEFEIAACTQRVKENALQAAEQQLRRRKIVAPIDGMVVDVRRRRGEWVEPGQTVVRILRLDRLRAEGFINAEQVGEKLAGQSVVLKVDLPGRPGAEFDGKLVFLSPEIDPINGQVRVWAEIENPKLLLRPGMRAEMVVGERE